MTATLLILGLLAVAVIVHRLELRRERTLSERLARARHSGEQWRAIRVRRYWRRWMRRAA